MDPCLRRDDKSWSGANKSIPKNNEIPARRPGRRNLSRDKKGKQKNTRTGGFLLTLHLLNRN